MGVHAVKSLTLSELIVPSDFNTPELTVMFAVSFAQAAVFLAVPSVNVPLTRPANQYRCAAVEI